MSKVHGRATITFNGQVYETEDGATLTLGGIKNNDRTTGEKFFFNQSYFASTLVCRIPKTKGLSLRTFQGMNEATIVIQSDTGDTWIMRDAAQTGEISIAGGADGGKFDVTFNGSAVEEMNDE